MDTIAQERFGISLSEACKCAGCEVRIERESQNGKYMIHVGQIHQRPIAEMFYLPSVIKSVARSQNVIYDLLSQLDNPTIIDEHGNPAQIPLFEHKLPLHEFDRMHQTAKKFPRFDFAEREAVNYRVHTDFPKGARSLGYISESYHVPDHIQKGYMEYFKTFTDKSLKDTLRKDQPHLDSFAIDTAIEIIKEFRQQGEAFHTFTLPLQSYKDRFLFANGATALLFLEGKPMQVLSGYNPNLILQFETAQDQAERNKAHNLREDEVVGKAIATQDSLPLIVYGLSHDFSDNIPTDYGVIRISTAFGRFKKMEGEVE